MRRTQSIGYAILILIMLVFLIVPTFSTPINANFVDTGDIVVSHDSIFSGSENIVHVETDIPISDVEVRLGGLPIGYSTYNTSSDAIKEPSYYYTCCGKANGDVEDLITVDEKGILYKKCCCCAVPLAEEPVGVPKSSADPAPEEPVSECCTTSCGPCCPAIFCVRFDSYFHLPLDLFQDNVTGIKLKYYANSTNTYRLVMSYYNFATEKWVSLFNTLVNTSGYIISGGIVLDNTVKNYSQVLLKVSGSCKKPILLDYLTLNANVSSCFGEDDLVLDVSMFVDNYYELKLIFTDTQAGTHEYADTIYVDNTAPVLTFTQKPSASKVYSSGSVLNFSGTIEDHAIDTSILSFKLNNSEYYSINLGNATSFSFKDCFLPGNYSYSLISEDLAGQISAKFGTFVVGQHHGINDTIEIPIYIETTEYTRLEIYFPPTTFENSFDVEIYFETNKNVSIEYKMYVNETRSLLQSGDVQNGTPLKLYMDLFDTEILLEIYVDGGLVYSNSFIVGKSTQPVPALDGEFIFILCTLISLLISIVGLMYGVYRDRRMDQEREIEQYLERHQI